MTTNFKSLIQVLDFFKEESTCIQYLAENRWADAPSCPHCGNVGAYVTNRGFKCKAKECQKKFTVTTGTVLENTKIDLRLWFATIYLATAHKKGISSHQLSRDLNITQKTAWFLLHRVREMFRNTAPEMLEGGIEVDETFVGGKNKNRHANKKIEGSQGRSAADKTPVIGIAQKSEFTIVERPHKVIAGKTVRERVYTKYSTVSLEVVANTTAETLHPIMFKNVKADSRIVTDAYRSYCGLSANYNHVSIKHTDGNYITVHLKDRNILIRENMSDIFDLVPPSDFIRVHKSYIVAIKHIAMIEVHQLTVNNEKIPIGSTYRESLRARLGIN